MEEYKDVLRRHGYRVDAEDDPIYVEPIDADEKRALKMAKINTLTTSITSMADGGLLAVPSMSHFGSPLVWFEAAATLAKKGCRVEDCESGKILDPSKGEDIATGAALIQQSINRRKGRAMTEKRLAAGVTGGRDKIKLTGPRLTEALALFVDLEWSVPAMAKHFEMSVSTFLRRIREKTGIGSREVAVRLHREGNWPPPEREPKRRASTLKGK